MTTGVALVSPRRGLAFLRDHPAAIIDLETTGINTNTARICDIAICAVDGGVVGEKYNELLRPPGGIPKAAADIHGITDEQVEDAVEFQARAHNIEARLENRILIGYNLLSYDVPLLKAEFNRIGAQWEPKAVLDVLVLVRKFDKWVRGTGRHKLSVTAERHKVVIKDAHRALGDCRMTWGVLWRLVEKEPKFFQQPIGEILSMQSELMEQQERERLAYLASKMPAEV